VTGASLLTIFGDGHARRKSLLGELIAAHQRTKPESTA
jgi:hypothetical protein